jgi:hypothetical protein
MSSSYGGDEQARGGDSRAKEWSEEDVRELLMRIAAEEPNVSEVKEVAAAIRVLSRYGWRYGMSVPEAPRRRRPSSTSECSGPKSEAERSRAYKERELSDDGVKGHNYRHKVEHKQWFKNLAQMSVAGASISQIVSAQLTNSIVQQWPGFTALVSSAVSEQTATLVSHQRTLQTRIAKLTAELSTLKEETPSFEPNLATEIAERGNFKGRVLRAIVNLFLRPIEWSRAPKGVIVSAKSEQLP